MNYPAASYGVVHLFIFQKRFGFLNGIHSEKPDGVDASPFKVRMNMPRLIGLLPHRFLL